jgi:hypothetical protein
MVYKVKPIGAQSKPEFASSAYTVQREPMHAGIGIAGDMGLWQ